MSNLTDDELISELQLRFAANRKALSDLTAMTGKLEEMNRKLRESESLKSHFLSNIRNEINNPLTSILGLSRQLVDHPNGAAGAPLASLIFSEAFYLDFQLRNIFIAAELEAGETTPDLARCNLRTLVEGIVSQFRHYAESKGVSLEALHQGEEATVTVDPRKLELVLTNLIANGIEFNRENGSVTAISTCADAKISIEVRDTGIGIDPKDHSAIFDRFRQLDSGTKKEYRGHGLGLSITRSLVDLLGGTIEVQSKSGDGCSFTISLPQIDLDRESDTLAQDGNMFIFDESLEF